VIRASSPEEATSLEEEVGATTESDAKEMEEDVTEYAKKSWSWFDEHTTLPESKWVFAGAEDALRYEVIQGTRFGVPWERVSFATPQRDEEEDEDVEQEEHSEGVAGRTSFVTPQHLEEEDDDSQGVVTMEPTPPKTMASKGAHGRDMPFLWNQIRKGRVMVLPDRCFSPRVLPTREKMMKNKRKGKDAPPQRAEVSEAHQWACDNWGELEEEMKKMR
jgi:hypothetical protein